MLREGNSKFLIAQSQTYFEKITDSKLLQFLPKIYKSFIITIFDKIFIDSILLQFLIKFYRLPTITVFGEIFITSYYYSFDKIFIYPILFRFLKNYK